MKGRSSLTTVWNLDRDLVSQSALQYSHLSFILKAMLFSDCVRNCGTSKYFHRPVVGENVFVSIATYKPSGCCGNQQSDRAPTDFHPPRLSVVRGARLVSVCLFRFFFFYSFVFCFVLCFCFCMYQLNYVTCAAARHSCACATGNRHHNIIHEASSGRSERVNMLRKIWTVLQLGSLHTAFEGRPSAAGQSLVKTRFNSPFNNLIKSQKRQKQEHEKLPTNPHNQHSTFLNRVV